MRCVLALLLMLVAGTALEAQLAPGGSVAFKSVPFERFGMAPPDTQPMRIKPTYWKQGALIGGAIGGLMGLLVAAAWCGDGDGGTGRGCAANIALGTLVVGGTGMALGAFIGSAFPKPVVSAEGP